MTDPIGAMREKVSVQEQSVASDGGGGGAVTWKTVDTVWAEIKPMGSSTKIRALEVNISVTHRIRVRYRTDLEAFDSNRFRLVWNNFVMRVDGITMIDDRGRPDSRRRFLELTCEQGQSVEA